MQAIWQNNQSVQIQGANQELKLAPYKLRELKEDEVLIMVEAATINPSDEISLLSHSCNPKAQFPLFGGKEGTGKVVKTGKKAEQFLGKRVSFGILTGGSWAQFTIANKKFTFIIGQDVPLSSAASGIVNPLTALGFLSETRRRKQTSIVHTAAASALGRMLNKICRNENITLLNIVRRKEQADLLKKEGAQFVIVTEGDWETAYADKIKELQPRIMFDALGGGEVQAKLIGQMPPDTTIIVYGILQGIDPKKPMTVPGGRFFSGLTITGFVLNKWLQTLSSQQVKEIRHRYSDYLKNSLSSTFSREFKLQEINEARKFYKQNPTMGKVLLRPGQQLQTSYC